MSRALRLALLTIVAGCAYLFLAHPYWFPAGASSSSTPIDHQFKIASWYLGRFLLSVTLFLSLSFQKSHLLRGMFPREAGGWKPHGLLR